MRRPSPHARALAALLFALVLLLPAPLAWADYLNGFDTYSGGASPGPFVFTGDSCFIGGVGTPQGFTLLSQPNIYEIIYTGSGGGCTGFSHQATLVLSTNTTQTSVGLRYAVSATWTNSIGTGTTVNPGVCGAVTAFNGFAVNTLPNGGNPTPWKKIGPLYSGPVTSGAKCPITIQVTIALADSAQLIAIYFDNLYVSGAAAVLPVYDFALYNLNTGRLYNVTAYDTPAPKNQTALGPATIPTGGLTLTTQYPALFNTPTNIVVGPLEPTLNLPLANANQVTVCVTALYCNSFIPAATGFTKAYLVAPSQAIACLIQVTNSANQFPAGSTITIFQGNTLQVAGGYLDANHEFPAFLPVGSYSLTLTFQTLSFQATFNIGATTCATPITIPVSGLAGNAFVGGLGTLSFNAGWDAALLNVVYYYTDTSFSTTYVNVQLLKRNASGQFVINTATYSPGPFGTIQGQFACSTNACNATLSAQLSVLFTATNQFGTKTPYGPVPLTSGGALPGIPGTPPSGTLGGMSEFFPGLNYLQLGAFFVLVVGASAFGEYEAPLGAIFLALLGAVLVGLGALAWPTLVTASLIVVGVLAFLEWREKRSMNPYGV